MVLDFARGVPLRWRPVLCGVSGPFRPPPPALPSGPASQGGILSERAIGIFDSGVGGLTVLKELARQLPGEELVYLGDTARVPYGTKSPATVLRYSLEAAAFLVKRRVKMLVVACNTASSVALEALEQHFSLPVVGVIEPGAARPRP